MNVELSLIVTNGVSLGGKTTLSHYRATLCAGVEGLNAFSRSIPIGEIPAHLLADGCTFQEVIESDWAAPLIAEAKQALLEKLERAKAAVA